jgi:hypothetical protein
MRTGSSTPLFNFLYHTTKNGVCQEIFYMMIMIWYDVYMVKKLTRVFGAYLLSFRAISAYQGVLPGPKHDFYTSETLYFALSLIGLAT